MILQGQGWRPVYCCGCWLAGSQGSPGQVSIRLCSLPHTCEDTRSKTQRFNFTLPKVPLFFFLFIFFLCGPSFPFLFFYCFYFLKNLLLLFMWKAEWHRERSSLSVGSFLKWPQPAGVVRTEAKSRELHLSLQYRWRGLKHSGQLLPSSRMLHHKWSGWGWSRSFMWGVCKRWLHLSCHNVSPHFMCLKHSEGWSTILKTLEPLSLAGTKPTAPTCKHPCGCEPLPLTISQDGSHFSTGNILEP